MNGPRVDVIANGLPLWGSWQWIQVWCCPSPGQWSQERRHPCRSGRSTLEEGKKHTQPMSICGFSASAHLERSNHFVFHFQVLFVFLTFPCFHPFSFVVSFLFFLPGFLLFHARTMSNNDLLRRPMACLCMPRSRDDKIQCSALCFPGKHDASCVS